MAVLDLRNLSAAPKILVTGGSQAYYVSSGHLVYAHAGTLRAVAFGLDRLETIGTSVPVVSEVVTLANGTAEFDIARSGTLVYVSGGFGAAPPRTLVWVDRQGREEPVKGLPARSFVGARLSPDGTRVALEIRDQDNDIWLWDFARGTLDRLTTDPGTRSGAGLDARRTSPGVHLRSWRRPRESFLASGQRFGKSGAPDPYGTRPAGVSRSEGRHDPVLRKVISRPPSTS